MKFHRLAVLGLVLGAASAARAFQERTRAGVRDGAAPIQQHGYVNIPRLPLGAMALAATEIVHARVDGVRTEFPERGLARTVYTMRVLSALKGNQLSTIEVAVAGARSQTHSVVIEGAPEFAFGEEAVLFLWTSPHDGETGVLGLGRGTYRVAVDAQDRRTVFGDHAQGVEVDEFLSQAADAWLVSQMQAEAKEGK